MTQCSPANVLAWVNRIFTFAPYVDDAHHTDTSTTHCSTLSDKRWEEDRVCAMTTSLFTVVKRDNGPACTHARILRE